MPQPRRSAMARLRDLPFPRRPDLVRRLLSPELEARLEQLVMQSAFDLVQIEGLEMALHWESLLRRGLASRSSAPARLPPAILDDHNAEYVLQRRAFEIDRLRPARWRGALYSLLQWRKLMSYERRFCRLVRGVVAASELDRQALLALDKRLRVAVVPNGVDTEYYCPQSAPESSGGKNVVFTGTMDFRPNVDGIRWFAEAIWPLVLTQEPDAKLWIVGRDPKPEVKRFDGTKNTVVTGAVDDVRPYLARASLMVVPLRIGGGSRLKVLEAMAAGVPVVSTRLGCEGIAVSESTAALADAPAGFCQAMLGLLRDDRRRRALSLAGRALVEEQYDWRVVVPKLEEFHCEVLGA